jgi:hypothetical protein
MRFELFQNLFFNVTDRETRTCQLRGKSEESHIPSGDYVFVESYCTDPDCDCERVLLNVVERRESIIVATLGYVFKPSRIPASVDQTNPFLDPLIPQSDYAEEILSLFKEIVLDEDYEERLKRHYKMVRAAVLFLPLDLNRRDAGVTGRQTGRAKQLRKQQKVARRKNRRR